MEYTAVYVRDRVHFGVEQPLASRLDAYNAIDIARIMAWYTLQCCTQACCAPKATANHQSAFSDATACAMQA